MKKIILALLMLFIGFFLQAQTSNTIVNTGCLWSIVSTLDSPPFSFSSYYIKFYGDSTINSITYKKVMKSNDSLHTNWTFEGLIREANNKTYFRFPDSTNEGLVYDFSVSVGDTLTINAPRNMGLLVSVTSIDSVNINGLKRKRIKLAYYPSTLNVDTWIEQIGSLGGILNSCADLSGLHESLLCYYEDNNCIYKNSSYQECFYRPGSLNGITIQKNEPLIVYPNPVKDFITVVADDFMYQLQIFDSNEREVFSQLFHDKQTTQTIDLHTLPNGLYIIKCTNSHKVSSTIKITKSH